MNRQMNQKHLNTYVTVTQITVTLYKTISYIRCTLSGAATTSALLLRVLAYSALLLLADTSRDNRKLRGNLNL